MAGTVGGRKPGPRSNLGAAAVSAIARIIPRTGQTLENVRVFETGPGFNLPVSTTAIFEPSNLAVSKYAQLFFHVFSDEEITLKIEWNTAPPGDANYGDYWVEGKSQIVQGLTTTSGVGTVIVANVNAPYCRFDLTAGATNPVTYIKVYMIGN